MDSTTQNHRVIGDEDLEQIRAKRVWQYLFVIWIGWIFFTVQFCLFGFFAVVPIALIPVVSLAVMYLRFRAVQDLSRHRATRITHTYLAIHCLAVFSVVLTYAELEVSLVAMPLATTVAFLLLGTRGAIPWLIVSLVAFGAFPVIEHGFAASLPPSLIFFEAMAKCGASILVFACICQFESLFLQQLFRLNREMEALATTDNLTGLPNRFHFINQVEQAVDQTQQQRKTMAVLTLDMDGFKRINDTLGHVAGDEALAEIAMRLRKTLTPNATVARLGGDEFCIVFRDVSSHAQVEEFSQRLHDALCREYQFGYANFHLGTSIGIALLPHHAQTADNLMAYSDTAMFYAKQNGLPYATYSPEQTARFVEYCSMQDKLSHALEREEFFLVYQPQTDTQSGAIIGAEALLRWRHNGKVIPPFEFIPHLEASHRMAEVTTWILNSVCEQINQWEAQGLRLKVAVNISATDFHSSGFNDMVTSTLERLQVDPSLLDLEITESVLIKDVSTVAEKMERLKETGLTISIDDFGTGYSSLAYIRSLPIDKLKIDREFVKGIPNTDDGTIASAIVSLAGSLGLEVLAEGVETQTQLEYLRSIDCHQFQGYLTSRPIPPSELCELVLETNADLALGSSI